MWEAMKNALMSVKEATGIEIPGLPVDLGSIGDSAATAVQSVTESAAVVLDGAATAGGAVVGGLEGDVTGLAETAAATVDSSSSQALPDLTGGLLGGSPEK